MPRKYDLDYLIALIQNKIEESLHLDYKAAEALGKTDSKKKEISKDVSAMANSAGGVIIYGIREYNEHEKKHLPEKLDPVSRESFSREWLDQVINSNIHPKISNLVITPVTISPLEVIYIVKIPQSDTVHQASDKRYYKRYNFESVPMDDYEIKDIMNRSKSPRIVLEFEIEYKSYENDYYHQTVTADSVDKAEIKKETVLNIYAHNYGNVYAEFVNFFIFLPINILNKGLYYNNDNYQRVEKNGDSYVIYRGDNTERDIVDYDIASSLRLPKYGPARYSPILPGLKKNLAKIYLAEEPDKDKEIRWIVYADNSKPIEDKIKISAILNKVHEQL